MVAVAVVGFVVVRVGNSDAHTVMADAITLASVTLTVAKHWLHAGPSAKRVGQKQASLVQIDKASLTSVHWLEH